jgi:hypothetical protein
MKTLIPLLASACLLILALSCGGDDSGGNKDEGGETEAPSPSTSPTSQPATQEEADYLNAQAQRMQTYAMEAVALNDTAVRAFDPAKSADQRVAGGRAYAVAYEEFVRNRLAGLSEPAPPDSLQDVHTTLIASATDAVTLAEGQRQRMEAETVSDSTAFTTIYSELNGVEVSQSYRDACAALVRRAVELQVPVELSCS